MSEKVHIGVAGVYGGQVEVHEVMEVREKTIGGGRGRLDERNDTEKAIGQGWDMGKQN